MGELSNNIKGIMGKSPYGEYILEYYATDRVNNTSTPATLRIRLSTPDTVKRWVGSNFTPRILGARQTGRIPYPKQLPIPTVLADIKSIGMNMVRIRMYWEGYRYFVQKGKADTYLNTLREVATEADRLGMGVVYDVGHQWHISSYFYEGVGFPHEVVSYLGERQRLDSNWQLAVRFWDDFLDNNITDTYTGKKIWESYWDDYFSKVVEITKEYRSTLGWCIINEPVLSGRDTLPEEAYDKLGAFHKYIGEKIVSMTPNSNTYIIIQRMYNGKAQWLDNKRYDLLVRTIPDIAQDQKHRLVFETHFYRPGNIPASTKQRWTEILDTIKLPLFVGEWNTDRDIELALDYAKDYLQTFKNWNAGSAFFTYDPGYPWSIKDDNYNDRVLSTDVKVRDILADAIRQVIG